MTNKFNRSLKIVTLASATVMLMISVAYATTSFSSKSSKTNGAKAVCSLETYPRRSGGLENNARITCEITDMEADGSTPYVLWQIDGYAERRINGSGPNGTVVQRVDSAGVNDGIRNVRFKACRDESFSFDDCDEYKTWRVR